MDAVPGDRPRCLAAHQPTPICAVRPSGRDDGTRHHPRARSMGARPAECINWVERYRFGLADDALRCACPLAAFCLGTVGHNGRWPVAVIRPACLLDSQCRSLHEQHDHRSACNNLLSSRADDAWHEPRRHDGREHSPSRMDILALLVAAAPANNGLAFLGFLIARYLTAYQLGQIGAIWEPFFSGGEGKNGTEFIITSDVSRAWPIADAGLGATSYMIEALMGAMGTATRWRTMPWMVTFFFILVVPLGGVSIFFIIIQPIMIGTYCTLCLIAAVAMLIMIPLTLDEVVAMGQYMLRSVHVGRPFWRPFFQGGPEPSGGTDESDPGFSAALASQIAAAVRGVTIPWTLLASCLVGAWLMFSRLIFGTEGAIANSDHLVGAMFITIAVCAMAEVARPLRFLNVPFGLWLVATPWLLAGAAVGSTFNNVLAGLVVIGLSLPRGRRSAEHYGGWDRYIV